MTQEQKYATSIFLNAALPLAKVIAMDRPKLGNKLKGKNIVLQVLARDKDGDIGTYFLINDGVWEVKKGIVENEKFDVGLIFKDIDSFINFFSGASKKLPKIVGFKKFTSLVSIMLILLKMASLLQSKDLPNKKEDRELLVKLFFYLLSSGISTLNKVEHPEIHEWAMQSPDRVYAFEVKDMPELSAYIRIKAGKSKAGRGVYQRSKPFFTLSFDSVESALGILMEKDDMIAATSAGRMSMGGPPEFGGILGNFMLLVGSIAKPKA